MQGLVDPGKELGFYSERFGSDYKAIHMLPADGTKISHLFFFFLIPVRLFGLRGPTSFCLSCLATC